MTRSNRLGITLRFNLEEQRMLQDLMAFLGRGEKEVLKFAFYQLHMSCKEVQARKLREQEEKSEKNNSGSDAASGGGRDDSDSPDVSGEGSLGATEPYSCCGGNCEGSCAVGESVESVDTDESKVDGGSD